MWESPTAFLLSLLVLASLVGMVLFAHDASGIGRVLLGLAHSVLQVASVAGVMIAASCLSSAAGLDGVWSLLAELGERDAQRLAAAMIMVAGAVWTHARPSVVMLAAYEADPELAAMRLDVIATLREILEVLIAGLLARPSR
jgi:hypothetical protein